MNNGDLSESEVNIGKPWGLCMFATEEMRHLVDLDLNSRYIKRKDTTFLIPAMEDVLKEVRPGDVLIVDRSLPPASGRIIIAEIAGRLTIRRVHETNGKIVLTTDIPDDPPCIVRDADDACWGVVTQVIHDV